MPEKTNVYGRGLGVGGRGAKFGACNDKRVALPQCLQAPIPFRPGLLRAGEVVDEDAVIADRGKLALVSLGIPIEVETRE